MSTVPPLPAWVSQLEDAADRLFAFDASRWPQDRKIIHDAVWGSRIFEPWEIAIIDLPIMQRLRSIRQLSMSFLVYPTAIHTRFEHSLGVASVAKDMLRQTELDGDAVSSANTITAALLHDIGHGPFSHLSEEMYYARQDWMLGVTDPVRDAPYGEAQPHEAIGALLLHTGAAGVFFEAMNNRFDLGLDARIVGDFISGNPVQGRGAYAAIVNGPTDADKIDYLKRDAFFSGIPLSLDVNRLLYALDPGDGDALTVGMKGVVPAEQITFAKATLTSALYHHRKVRASDCAFKGFAERLIRLGSEFGGRKIESPADMLNYTDADFLSFGVESADARCNDLIRAIRLRELPISVRELRFSEVDTTSEPADKFAALNALRNRPAGRGERHHAYERLRDLANDLRTAIGNPAVHREQVWVDIWVCQSDLAPFGGVVLV